MLDVGWLVDVAKTTRICGVRDASLGKVFFVTKFGCRKIYRHEQWITTLDISAGFYIDWELFTGELNGICSTDMSSSLLSFKV